MRNKIKNKNFSLAIRGFTLIELLVVIAIIALLVVINFLAVSHYRNQAKDSRIQATLGQIRSVAAIISNDSGSYVIMCDGGTINQAVPDLKTIEDETMKLNQNQIVKCYATGNSFCVSTPLNFSGTSFCVDYLGYAGTEAAACDSAAMCH